MPDFIFHDDGFPHITKDPQANLDYTFNWSAWLAGDTIATPSVTVSSEGTKGDVTNTSTAVTVFVSGGVVGQTITVTCHIVTAAGRTDERTIMIDIKER